METLITISPLFIKLFFSLDSNDITRMRRCSLICKVSAVKSFLTLKIIPCCQREAKRAVMIACDRGFQ